MNPTTNFNQTTPGCGTSNGHNINTLGICVCSPGFVYKTNYHANTKKESTKKRQSIN